MTWFEKLTRFRERGNPDEVRTNITVDGEKLTSHVNGRTFVCGRFETPSLGELRERARRGAQRGRTIALREVVADVQRLHADPNHDGALFQVASQFNALEMISPDLTPEEGVGIYERDHTQGPACAIAAGAGTIYRNYFVPVNGRIGQSEENQIDCLADLGDALGNTHGRLWRMRNGYALPSREGLLVIAARLRDADEVERDQLRSLLRIGLQWNTHVTLEGASHTVSQAYCSALPVGYSNEPTELWRDFACLVLEASYEATLCAALENAEVTGDTRVFLTLLGGGAFGNELSWILAALERALRLYTEPDLDVAIVSFGAPNAGVRELVRKLS